MGDVEVHSAFARERRLSSGENTQGHSFRSRVCALAEQRAKRTAGDDVSAPVALIDKSCGTRALHWIEKVKQRGDISSRSDE
jgi:hypothetical protein